MHAASKEWFCDYIYINDKKSVQSIFQSVDALADDIKHKAKTIQYVPVMTDSERYLHQIAEQSARSTDKLFAYIVMAIFILVGIPFMLFVLLGIIMALAGT